MCIFHLGLECDLDIKIFKSSQGYSNVSQG
jgi:hypothetical protein